MDLTKLRDWFHLRIKTVETAREACLSQGDLHHSAARHADGAKAEEERAQAEEFHAAAKDLRDGRHGEPRANSMRDRSDDSIHGNSAPVQVTKFELGEKAGKAYAMLVIALVGLMVVIGACGVVMGIDINDRAAKQREYDHEMASVNEHLQDLQRQYRMTELKLDDWTVVAHRAGLQLPGDYTRGPQGNLDSESFHLQEKDHGSRRDNQSARGH